MRWQNVLGEPRMKSKKELKNYITETLRVVYGNPELYSREAVTSMLHSEVDKFCVPLDDWITEDGSLHSVIEVVEDMLE